MNALQVSTMRPGILVSLKTSIKGNVDYSKTEIDPEHVTADGVQEATWQTTRRIEDAAEHERAKIARGKCRSVITSVCSASEHGLLCLQSRKNDLESAIAESHRLADDFNRNANLSKITVAVICGEIARDDVEAVRAINREVRELMESMSAGVKNLDADAIRDACNKARNLATMLIPSSAEHVQQAIDAARKAARAIVKAGEQAAVDIDANTLTTIAGARTAFLDLHGDDTIAQPETESRGVDLAPESLEKRLENIDEFRQAMSPAVQASDAGEIVTPNLDAGGNVIDLEPVADVEFGSPQPAPQFDLD